MIAQNDATERQVQAARPDASTWLAANAGSGKTRVLTDRVARLLLNGVRPEHILCLTYTRAAASEMQNRLFKRLGAWAMLDDKCLTKALEELGAGLEMETATLSHARTLFARAIEAPGGLKIQTIHSFCASLLRRFPLEAGVSPQFTEMEPRADTLLQAEIIEDFSKGPHAGLIDRVARFITDTGFDPLTRAVVKHRNQFLQPLEQSELMRALNLPPGFDDTQLHNKAFLGDEANLLDQLRTALLTGSVTDQKAAQALAHIKSPTCADLPVLEAVFLTKSGANPFTAKIGKFPTKKVQESHASLMPPLEDFMCRVETARSLRLAIGCIQKATVLHDFAAAFVPEYTRRKQLRGWLDFDDLIQKTRDLLNDPSVAQWVLFRLDGGIDHILVDEAQDTSPDQWDVVEKLAQEFTSGQGAHAEKDRTIFVVGDKKQSIYSFQGADPNEFDRMQAEFALRLKDNRVGLQDMTLEYSFRSSDAILRFVDTMFTNRDDAGFRSDSQHRAFKTDMPGRVDLWPVIEKITDDDNRVWTDPVDRLSPQHHTLVLAEKIASSIKTMIDKKETIPVDGVTPGTINRRPVQPGDFLILVQRRSELFAEIIRACKKAELAIAGADRLKVGAELAVKDLAALLRFLATPEDSLSLAAALRSPLFGWDEQMLFDLAHRRKTPFLWAAMRARRDEYPETMRIIEDLMEQTDFLRPYDLIERILTRHEGRRKLVGRLGTEVEDGINALLSQALSYERTDIPSLTGFLVWMETDDLDIKREMGSAGNVVRVMTVHGAKGLEAPIVILPDTGPRQIRTRDTIVTLNQVPLWRMNTAEMPDEMTVAHAQAVEKEKNERLRLLYVALTRAEKWLIVAAAGDLGKSGEAWYQIAEQAMREAGAQEHDFEGVSGLRLSHGDWYAPDLREEPVVEHQVEPLPSQFRNVASPPKRDETTISPSDLGGAKALAGDAGLDEDAAKLWGQQLHTLLEHLPNLPEQEWADAASSLLQGLTDNVRHELLSEAKTVLKAPALAHIFAPDTLAEVSVSGTVFGHRTRGIIDRLVVTPDRILAVDFKTNRTVPNDPTECPEGILRQLGCYVNMLEQIYPKRHIETAVLWTRRPVLMSMPHDLVTAALLRSPRLDVSRDGS